MRNCNVSEQGLSDWFATPQGRYVLVREQSYFDRTISDIFGFNALQLGLPDYPFLRNNRMALRMRAGMLDGNDLLLNYHELPFASASLDLVLMPHVLEFAEHPHQILREIERVLMPEGELIISAFNPRSLWGIRRLCGSKQQVPWNGHFISLSRIKDWLALLGFEVVGGRFAAYAPPFEQNNWMERFAFMEAAGDRWWAISGGIYFVHAIKRVHGMNLITPLWKKSLVDSLLPVSRPALNNQRKSDMNHKP